MASWPCCAAAWLRCARGWVSDTVARHSVLCWASRCSKPRGGQQYCLHPKTSRVLSACLLAPAFEPQTSLVMLKSDTFPHLMHGITATTSELGA